MGHFKDVIQLLKKDLKKKGLERISKNIGLVLLNGAIEIKMLNCLYLLTESGVLKGGEEASELEHLLILNAALCPGRENVSKEWKPYEKFSGTVGHVDLFRTKVEGALASISESVISKKELIVKRFQGEILDNIGGSDLAFTFKAFPNIYFFCQVYLKDDEFPADAKLFFSANADGFMPPLCLEQLAVLWVKQIKKLVC